MAFDDWGRETKRKALRADGSPNLDPQLGVATRGQVYDKQGNWIEEAFYDARDRLAIGPDGYAKVVLRRHADGSEEWIHIGTEGKPALNPMRGYAIWKLVVGKDGSKVESYHDAEGALMAGPEGYAEVRRRSSDDGTLLEEAFFGPDGSPVAGPDGFHRMERKPGSLLKSAKHFDTSNRELTSIGPDSVVSIIFVAGIHGMRPAAKAGVHVGDVLWQYGSWSFPDALEEECLKATPGDKILRAVYKKFIAERDRLSGEAVPMVVLRDGRPVQLTMAPLLEKTDGMEVTKRSVPRSVFEDWKKNCCSAFTAIARDDVEPSDPIRSPVSKLGRNDRNAKGLLTKGLASLLAGVRRWIWYAEDWSQELPWPPLPEVRRAGGAGPRCARIRPDGKAVPHVWSLTLRCGSRGRYVAQQWSGPDAPPCCRCP
jgi:hypothetical protein